MKYICFSPNNKYNNLSKKFNLKISIPVKISVLKFFYF